MSKADCNDMKVRRPCIHLLLPVTVVRQHPMNEHDGRPRPFLGVCQRIAINRSCLGFRQDQPGRCNRTRLTAIKQDKRRNQETHQTTNDFFHEVLHSGIGPQSCSLQIVKEILVCTLFHQRYQCDDDIFLNNCAASS